MRGTECAVLIQRQSYRITPACAGNSGWHTRVSPIPRDHPRVCGEQFNKIRVCGSEEGSPPRVRGTVVVVELWPPEPGITPACAGNSRSRYHCERKPWDHPRVCGEQYPNKHEDTVKKGSPPRVRGTVISAMDGGKGEGITPACAGNSCQ